MNWYSKIWEDLALQQHYRLFVQLESGTLGIHITSVFLPSRLSLSPLFVSSPNSMVFLILFLLTFYKYGWKHTGAQQDVTELLGRGKWKGGGLAYTEKNAPVIKCYWPQRMYLSLHRPSPSFLPVYFPILIHLFYFIIILDIWFWFVLSYCNILFDHE